MKTVHLIYLFGLIATVTWSCSKSSSPAAVNENFSSDGPYAKATKISIQTDSLNQLAEQIPGFGGLFLNNSDQLSIYLTNPDEQQAKAQEVLSNSEFIQEALSNSSASVDNIATRKGQYTFITLEQWKKDVGNEIISMDGVHTVGIDQSRNKLSIGAENKETLNKIIQALPELSIPNEAVIIYQISVSFPIGH